MCKEKERKKFHLSAGFAELPTRSGHGEELVLFAQWKEVTLPGPLPGSLWETWGEKRGRKHEREEGRDINQKGGGELYWNRKWPQQNQSNVTVHSPYSVTQSCVTVCNHYIMCLVHLYKSTGQYMFYHHIIAQKSKGPCPLWRRSMWQWGLKSFVADEALRAETRDTVGVWVCQVWTEAAH